jgi:hypothetical protein
VVVVIATAAWLATPWYVGTRLLPDLWAQYGLTLTAERQDLSVADGTAELHGIRVFDGKEEVLAAKRMEVRVSLRGLYEGQTIFERVVLDDPVVHARLGADGHTNVGRILERRTGSQAVVGPATLWNEVLVHGGTLDWDDPARGMRVRILDIEVAVLDMQTGSGERQDRFGQITFDANLEQPSNEPAPLSIVHWQISSDQARPTFVANAALTDIDLDTFPGYVDAVQRASLGVDHLDLVVSMDVQEGIIRRGVAVATSPERTRPLTLLFGGPFGEPVLDRSSRLLALWELPFSRLGRVGDVAWELGGTVVGGAVGIVDGFVQGDLPGAEESTLGIVGGGALEHGSNTLDALEGFGRALGLVAPEAARDTVAIHAQRRALFLAARREAAAQSGTRAHDETRDEASRRPARR